MKKIKTVFILFLISLSGCVSFDFYTELQSKHSIVEQEYSNVDSSFFLSHYFICYENKRCYTIHETDYNMEDSILNIFKLSLRKKNLSIISDKGKNLITNEFCEIGKKFITKKFHTHIDSLINNTSFFNANNISYIVPYIFLIERCQKTNFPTGNVYINYFGAAVMINIIKNGKIIYSKLYDGGGVTDNKSRVTDDWPNCPDPPEVFYEQAHWDTLVGLAMEDYMKRLNVEKR